MIIPHYILYGSLEHVCRGTGAPLKAQTSLSCLPACFLSHPCLHAGETGKTISHLSELSTTSFIFNFTGRCFECPASAVPNIISNSVIIRFYLKNLSLTFKQHRWFRCFWLVTRPHLTEAWRFLSGLKKQLLTSELF